MRFVGLLLCIPAILAASEGMGRYLHGDYEGAVPLLRAEAKAVPNDDRVAAALLASLVERNLYGEAVAVSERVAAQFPKSAVAVTARGDLEFLRGRIFEAEQLYRSALAIDDRTARAFVGLYQVMRAHSRYSTARRMALRAHELLPEDAAVRMAWIGVAPEEKQMELLSALDAEHPAWDPRTLRRFHASLELRKALNGREPMALEGTAAPATVKLVRMMHDASHPAGWGVKFMLNGKRTVTLEVDTGAGGIVLDEKVAARAGIRTVADVDVTGVGDEGARKMSVGLADTCGAPPVTFRDCVVQVLPLGKVTGRDGLIGTNIFNDFLVRVSFKNEALQLTPLAERPKNPQGYDREMVPGFTPVISIGHSLHLPTRLNNSEPGLFVIDTGSPATLVDHTFASAMTKLGSAGGTRIRGFSGEVRRVREASAVTLRFAGFEQLHQVMTSVDLSPEGRPTSIREAGLLGMDVLRLFDVTLDYRNGLVKFEYLGRR